MIMMKKTKMMNRKTKILLSCTVLILIGYIVLRQEGVSDVQAPTPVLQPVTSAPPGDEPMVVEAESEPVTPPPIPKQYRIKGVPFTVQAPFAEWSNPIFQDACEEASLIMADAWAQEKTLTKEGAKQAITALAAYQTELRGHAIDTSIEDTRDLLKNFFAIETAIVQRDVTIDDIKEALRSDSLVIVPTDGRKLKNPNFTAPGPPRHMLVIVGYDDVTNEFIVNDPGTRKGEGYRYEQPVLFDAILDYPTGDHVVATSTDKVMITVWQ